MKRRMKFLNQFISIFIFISSCNLIGQDFQLDEFNQERAIYFSKKNRDSFLFYSKEMQKSRMACRKFTGLSYEAKYLYIENKLEESKDLCLKVLIALESSEIKEEYDYSKMLVGRDNAECIKILKLNLHRRLFQIYNTQQEIGKAYYHLTRRQDILNSLKEIEEYFIRNNISLQNSIAALQTSVGLYDESNRTLRLLGEKFEEVVRDTSDVFYKHLLREEIYMNTFHMVNYLNKYRNSNNISNIDSVNYYNNRIFSLVENLETRPTAKLNYYVNKSYTYIANNQIDSLDFAFAQVENFFKKYNKPNHQTLIQLKCSVFHKKGQIDSSLYYCNKFLDLEIKEVSYKDVYLTIYDKLAIDYSKSGISDSALFFRNKHFQLNNKLKERSVNALNEMRKVEAKRYDGAIKNNSATIIKARIIVLFLLGLFLAGIYVLRGRYRRRQKELIIYFEKQIYNKRKKNLLNQSYIELNKSVKIK